jgi:hypothetical protein
MYTRTFMCTHTHTYTYTHIHAPHAAPAGWWSVPFCAPSPHPPPHCRLCLCWQQLPLDLLSLIWSTRLRAHTYQHVYVVMRTHTYTIHTRVHIHTRAHTNTHVYTHVYTHRCTHTRTQVYQCCNHSLTESQLTVMLYRYLRD